MNIRRNLATLATVAMSLGLVAACSSDDADEGVGGSGSTTLNITTNAIEGGKNSAEAEWIENYVIPEFEKAQKQAGNDVTVKFVPQGVDDEDYKTKIALDFQSGRGADVVGIDGIWVGEFAQAGYIKPLSETAGDAVDEWEGWDQIPDAVQGAMSFEDVRYGVPGGADGRVLYYNKDLFEQAGLSRDWQPESWDDVLEAARSLKTVDGVTPIQLNAGTAMGEATTMQGFLPLLAATGERVWTDDKWVGDTEAMREALGIYETIYVDEELGDPILQQETAGRDTSFDEFSKGHIGILLEGDYFWRSVINPAEGVGTAPMEDRDDAVGYVKIPAIKTGQGIDGQDYVSMSGGAGRVLNPNSDNPELAWELLAFMNSAEAYQARVEDTIMITPRDDVNADILADDPMLTYISEEVLPITSYRPPLAEYPEVSVALQQLTLDVTTGMSVEDALAEYTSTLESIVGAENISE